MMPAKNLDRKSSKRKQIDDEEPQAELQSNGVLEMLSEDEDDGDVSSDDGQLDEFPEIVTDSDSEEDEDEDGDEDEEERDATSDEEDEDEDEEDADSDASDTSLHIFPKAKVIVSDITKQPKNVYPEIEPDYDSDSSTEDVSPLSVPTT